MKQTSQMKPTSAEIMQALARLPITEFGVTRMSSILSKPVFDFLYYSVAPNARACEADGEIDAVCAELDTMLETVRPSFRLIVLSLALAKAVDHSRKVIRNYLGYDQTGRDQVDL